MQILLRPGQQNDQRELVVPRKRHDGSKGHRFSALDVSNSETCASASVDFCRRLTPGENGLGLLQQVGTRLLVVERVLDETKSLSAHRRGPQHLPVSVLQGSELEVLLMLLGLSLI